MPEISTEPTPTATALEWVPIPAEIVRLGGSALPVPATIEGPLFRRWAFPVGALRVKVFTPG